MHKGRLLETKDTLMTYTISSHEMFKYCWLGLMGIVDLHFIPYIYVAMKQFVKKNSKQYILTRWLEERFIKMFRCEDMFDSIL